MAATEPRYVPHLCLECLGACPVMVRVEGGVVTRIEGNPTAPSSLGRLCPKGNSSLMRVYDPHRLKKPLLRTNPAKGKGVDPRWREITWDEALDILTRRLEEQRQENPAGLMVGSMDIVRTWLLYPWGRLFGTISCGPEAGIGGGSQCGNPSHTLGELTWNSFLEHADWARCNYLISLGSSMGHEAMAPLVYTARMMADARMRGMKYVVVDPRLSNAAAKADEWISIRPGSDGALALGMAHVLIHELRVWDGPFLKKHTNAPYLVQANGYYLRQAESGKPLVWDARAGAAKVFDDPTVADFALEGEFTVAGVRCRPGFELLKERMRDYTPEWAERETTVPAATVRKLAREITEAAMIGSFVEIDGELWPYRPVAIIFYRGVEAHRFGTNQAKAIYMLLMLLGALGAVGGQFAMGTMSMRGSSPMSPPDVDGVVDPHAVWMLSPHLDPKFPPEQPNLREWVPFANPDVGAVYHLTGADSDRFGQPRKRMLICDNTNPLHAIGDPKVVEAGLRDTYVVMMEHYMTDTAWVADLVLPCNMQLERAFYGPLRDNNVRGLAYGPRVLNPPGEARDFFDVLIEVSERMGILYGPGGYNATLNAIYGLEPPHVLELDKKYTWDEIAERVAFGIAGASGAEQLRREGMYVTEWLSAGAKYMRHRRARIPLYNELLKRTGDRLQALMAEYDAEKAWGVKWDFSGYDPLPAWDTSWRAQERSGEYDLLAINYKPSIFTFSRSAYNPWLMEVAEKHPFHLRIWMNPATAAARNISDGELVCVESRVGKLTGPVRLTQGIHPECVAVAGTLGQRTSHPIAGGKGSHFNALIPFDFDHVDTFSGAFDNKPAVKVYAVAARA